MPRLRELGMNKKNMQKTNAVSLTVNRQVELERGVVLTPGVYAGTSTQLCFPRVDDVSWTKPEFTIKLDEAQLREMGNKHLRTATYVVTKLVKFGDITVSGAEEDIGDARGTVGL